GVGAAVEFRAATLGHHADDAIGIAAVFRLVVAGEDAHLGDGVHGRLEVSGAVGAGVQVSDAVHGEVGAGIRRAVDAYRADGVLTGGVARGDGDAGDS